MPELHPEDLFNDWQEHEILKARQTRPPVTFDIVPLYTRGTEGPLGSVLNKMPDESFPREGE